MAKFCSGANYVADAELEAVMAELYDAEGSNLRTFEMLMIMVYKD